MCCEIVDTLVVYIYVTNFISHMQASIRENKSCVYKFLRFLKNIMHSIIDDIYVSPISLHIFMMPERKAHA